MDMNNKECLMDFAYPRGTLLLLRKSAGLDNATLVAAYFFKKTPFRRPLLKSKSAGLAGARESIPLQNQLYSV